MLPLHGLVSSKPFTDQHPELVSESQNSVGKRIHDSIAVSGALFPAIVFFQGGGGDKKDEEEEKKPKQTAAGRALAERLARQREEEERIRKLEVSRVYPTARSRNRLAHLSVRYSLSKVCLEVDIA